MTSTELWATSSSAFARPARAEPASRGVFVALVVICLLTVFPLIWMVSSAFKPGEDVYSLSIIPESPTLDNFRYVFTEVPFPRYMFNSFFVSATVTRDRALLSLHGGLRAGPAALSRVAS